MKIATILEETRGEFGLEYDNTLGKKNTMRLEAGNYEKAIREAKAFLGINGDDRDADGHLWEIS